jgi:hypothetical protein
MMGTPDSAGSSPDLAGGPMTDARTAPGVQRLVALVLLLAAGILSLPLAALAFDGEGTENYILPAQLAGMAVFGAVVGYLLPGLGGQDSSSRRSLWIGLGLGLLFALIGVLLFFLLLNGFDGT